MNCSNSFQHIESLISFPVPGNHAASKIPDAPYRCALGRPSISRIRSTETGIGLVRTSVTMEWSRNTLHQKLLRFLHNQRTWKSLPTWPQPCLHGEDPPSEKRAIRPGVKYHRVTIFCVISR